MKRFALAALNVSFATLLWILPASLSAQKSWVSADSGFWRDGTNWSGGTPPGNTNTVQITNPNSKVVTIDAATPPENLTITRLSLWGTNTFTNTVIAADLTTNNPLSIMGSMVIGKGGA